MSAQQTQGGKAVYRTSRGHRALSILGAAAMLFVIGSDLTGGDPLWTWGQLVDAALLGAVLLGGADGFLARIEIGDRTLWKRRPLWTDEALSLSKVRRVHFPTTQSGLWLYTDPDGDPALTIGGRFERFGNLAVQIADQLPDAAEVIDPAGRLEKYWREHGDSDR